MKKSSIAIATLFIAFLGTFVYLSRGMSSFTRSGVVGPGFVPRMFLYGGIICAVVVILESLFSKKQPDKLVHTNILVAKIAVTGLSYVLIMNLLGYFISTFMALAALMYMLGVKNKPQIIGVSLAFILVVYVVFVMLLSIPVPKAPFGGGVI